MTQRQALEEAARMLADAGLENGGEVAGREAALRLAEIYRHLDEFAPFRNERQCPACGRLPDLDCHEPYTTARHGSGFRNRAIPHEARLVERQGEAA